MKTYIDFLIDYYPAKANNVSDSDAKLSNLVLKLKKDCPIAHVVVLDLLMQWCSSNINLEHFVMAIPSSNKSYTNTITKIAKDLSKHHKLIIDYTFAIQKQASTKSFCHSGIRDAFSLSKSIYVDPIVKGKHILLLDDITTTGLSMFVVEKLLLSKGALSVTCLAIGKTVKLYNR